MPCSKSGIKKWKPTQSDDAALCGALHGGYRQKRRMEIMNQMRFFLMILWAVLPIALQAAGPGVESIEYVKPEKYLEFPDSLGTRTVILAHAAELKGDNDLDTLRNVLNWMRRNLKYDGDKAYAWRNYDDVLREKAYGGCADEAIVCGVLLKGAGIPAVWVKTMDVSWIWDFKKDRPFKSWSGHVFLEVFVNGQWALLDPGARTLYREYTPQMRFLPGQRFAYDKGNDPKSMVMSLQWEEWKRQTELYFRALDESLLPVDEKSVTPLARQAFVIGNSPYYQTMEQMAAESGFLNSISFNTDYDRHLPQARGHVLLIETHKGAPVIHPEMLEKHFPGAMNGITDPSKMIRIQDTTIVFVEFSRQLQDLSIAEPLREDSSQHRPEADGDMLPRPPAPQP